jgi:hypothetical protein
MAASHRHTSLHSRHETLPNLLLRSTVGDDTNSAPPACQSGPTPCGRVARWVAAAWAAADVATRSVHYHAHSGEAETSGERERGREGERERGREGERERGVAVTDRVVSAGVVHRPLDPRPICGRDHHLMLWRPSPATMRQPLSGGCVPAFRVSTPPIGVAPRISIPLRTSAGVQLKLQIKSPSTQDRTGVQHGQMVAAVGTRRHPSLDSHP